MKKMIKKKGVNRLIHASAVTFCDPVATSLKQSFKGGLPCGDSQDHLTQNFTIETEFSSEGFLATSHWLVSLSIPEVENLSILRMIPNQKPDLTDRFLIWCG